MTNRPFEWGLIVIVIGIFIGVGIISALKSELQEEGDTIINIYDDSSRDENQNDDENLSILSPEEVVQNSDQYLGEIITIEGYYTVTEEPYASLWQNFRLLTDNYLETNFENAVGVVTRQSSTYYEIGSKYRFTGTLKESSEINNMYSLVTSLALQATEAEAI